MIKRAEWIAISKDRTAILLLVVLVFSILGLVASTVFRLLPSDVQIPFRYTDYGFTNIYRDQWYSLYSFVGFAVIIATFNTFLAVKLFNLRRMISLGIIGISIFLTLLATLVANALLNLSAIL